MHNDGTGYEMFVQKLQQSILDSEPLVRQKNIKVERNVHLKDTAGIVRQFDLYWEYELGGITYKTIIECKDYASTVTVDKIDALIGKIKDFPDIKPIIATKTGFQNGAEKRAKFNKIELLIVREQRDEDWRDEEGNDLIKKIHINMQFIPPCKILQFLPKVDSEWAKLNSGFVEGDSFTLEGLNSEIFLRDEDSKSQYSLYELQSILNLKSGNSFGELNYHETFNNAFIFDSKNRFKIKSFDVKYIRSKPDIREILIDWTEELIGVIEYISKGSSVAIFKNNKIQKIK